MLGNVRLIKNVKFKFRKNNLVTLGVGRLNINQGTLHAGGGGLLILINGIMHSTLNLSK